MKPSPFLILGLPRSRTAWLSLLFTVGDCYCFHDLTADVLSIPHFAQRLTMQPGRIVGDSDSGALLILEELLEELPDARICYVRRPMCDALVSFATATRIPTETARPMFHELEARLDAAEKRWPGASVTFAGLDRPEEIQRIWAWLTHGAVFPAAHYQRMRNMIVCPDPDYLQEVARTGRHCVLTGGLQ